MNKLKFLFAFALIALVACKKEDKIKDVLTSKTWKPTRTDKNLALTPGIPKVTTSYYPVRECDEDDIYTFDKNGKLTINYGSKRCNEDQVNPTILNYSYNRESKELIIEGQKFTVSSEKPEQLKYYAPLPRTSGYEYVVYLFE